MNNAEEYMKSIHKKLDNKNKYYINKLPYTIDKSGNYYLSKNLDFDPDDGNNIAIHIHTNNVILNGNKYYINLKNENSFLISNDDHVLQDIHIFNMNIFAYDPDGLIVNNVRNIGILRNCNCVSVINNTIKCYGNTLFINSICDDV
jgi:hypothetical protein